MNFYIPVEVKDRELYAKLLLAKYAVKSGFNVILGKKNDLNRLVLSMPKGIYYGLGIAENYNDFFEKLSKLGHLVVVGEEEGLVTYSDEMYLDMRISPKTIKHVDLIFTWGKENFNIINKGRKNITSKLRVTGNPRLDLLKPNFSEVYQNNITSIRSKYNEFILVCTSFPSCNHFIKDINYVQSLIDKKTLKDNKSIKNFKKYQEVKTKTFTSFLEVIPQLAVAFPDTEIVVRPHPSESKEVYQILADKFINVFVESDFSVHPWILCSKAVIHHYCTTSIEAFAAGIPRFSLRPLVDTYSEKEIPFKCSNEFKTSNALIEGIKSLLFKNIEIEDESEMRKDYEHYVLNMGESISSDLIINEIINHIKINPKNNNKEFFIFQSIKEYKGRLEFLLRKMIRNFFMENHVAADYTNHKFDTLSLIEIQEVLFFFSKNDDVEFKCMKLDKHFVRITKSS
ncbi:surface carbohydrate biosynthesis protein [Candidatus Pseudothioglobus sp. Uisw_086]|jgi:surface carbohydrate biosynthesis protein|uniref:surface carbohydrate biosynthesis protein n=1 Tax=Candidatus Pseudothioglobus sp. Uisw_086 TaxID=3230998 RepID=UPI003A8B1587